MINKAKEEGKDFHKFLRVYHNTPLTGHLQLPIQILQGRSARSDLPMSNAATHKFGINPGVLMNIDKHDKFPMHDLHVGQHIMFLDSASMQWHPAIIISLWQERQSYMIKTSDGVIY